MSYAYTNLIPNYFIRHCLFHTTVIQIQEKIQERRLTSGLTCELTARHPSGSWVNPDAGINRCGSRGKGESKYLSMLWQLPCAASCILHVPGGQFPT
jgi:hypothetical protein